MENLTVVEEINNIRAIQEVLVIQNVFTRCLVLYYKFHNFFSAVLVILFLFKYIAGKCNPLFKK